MSNNVDALDWDELKVSLDTQGFALTPPVLSAHECDALIALYAENERFRNTVVMARHQFGLGEYRYFGTPLPDEVQDLRSRLYARLAPVANDWHEALRLDSRFPPLLDSYQAICHAAGQTKPTPLLLRYEAGGYNCLHQDKYGELAFPLQVTCLLSEPGVDFDGGEFMLVENRPRMQSRGSVLNLRRGQCVIFANQIRPVLGSRGHYRVQVRHGVSSVHSGLRMALGLIFHDAA